MPACALCHRSHPAGVACPDEDETSRHVLRLDDTDISGRLRAARSLMSESDPTRLMDFEVDEGTMRLELPDLGRRYRAIREIGRGETGVVYEAEHLDLARRFAVKRLLSQATDKVALESLRHEARMAASLKHENLVDVVDYDFGTDGVPFLVMELLQGEDLGTRVGRQGPYEPGEAIAILAQVCDALDAVHAVGVVHRDLKPSHIFLARGRSGETVKILDFGVAAMKTPAGTNASMPRQVSPGGLGVADPAEIRLDVWAAASLLYFMVTGQLACDLSGVSLADPATFCRPPPARQLRPSLSPELEEVLERAFDEDPERRFASGLELFHAAREAVPQPVVVPEHSMMTPTPPTETYLALTSGSSWPGLPVPPQLLARGLPRVAVLRFTELGRASAATTTPAQDDSGSSPVPGLGDSTILSDSRDPSVTAEDSSWLGTAIAETLTGALQDVASIQVVDRVEVEHAIGAGAEDPAALGRLLGLDLVVAGSVQRSGDDIRLVTRVMRPNGSALAVVRLDGRVDGLFDLQDRLAVAVGRELGARAEQVSEEQRLSRGTEDQQAYQALMQATALLYDPGLTPANFDAFMAACDQAILRDPRYAEARYLRGNARLGRLPFGGADQERKRAHDDLAEAARLRPSWGLCQAVYGICLGRLGDLRSAVKMADRAVELDPDHPYVSHHAGTTYDLALRPDRALNAWAHALTVDSHNGWARVNMASIRRVQGRHPEAVDLIKAALEIEREDFEAGQGPGRRTRRSFRWFRLIAARLAWGLLLLDEDRRAEARDELMNAKNLISRADHFHRSGFLACAYRGLEELARRRGLQGELNEARRGARSAEERLVDGAADEIDGACRISDAYRLFFPRRSIALLQPFVSVARPEMRVLLAHAQAAVRALDCNAARTGLERLYETSGGSQREEALFLLHELEEGWPSA